MSEDEKMILALVEYLGLEMRLTGQGVTNEKVESKHFAVDNPEYAYTVTSKPQFATITNAVIIGTSYLTTLLGPEL